MDSQKLIPLSKTLIHNPFGVRFPGITLETSNLLSKFLDENHKNHPPLTTSKY